MMGHKYDISTISTVAALGLAAVFLGIQLAAEPASPVLWLALTMTVLALCLLPVLISAHRRDIAALEEEYRQELEEQQRACQEQAAKATAQAEQELNTFRSGLAHSLRMPIAIIQGYADLLSSGVVTEPAVRDEYLRKISDRSQYMTEMISRQFSAMESLDPRKLHYSDLDLMTLLRQAAADMQTAAADHGIAIQVVSTEETIPICADAYLLDRVLFNLLENAVKYMGRPGVVTIRAVPEEDRVSIRVQDDGMGLSAEETAHIFESNYQGSNRAQGQGLGLYLVKRAVESHGGTISAQSAPGRGMGITMTFPLAPAAQTAD